MIRSREVASERKARFECLVVMELGAVVQGERVESSGLLDERLAGCAGHLFGCAGAEFFDHRITGFTFQQGENAVMLVLPDDRVAFPMPDLQALFDGFAALADVALASQNASRILAVVTLAPKLGHDPHAFEERTSRLLVTEDVAVDRFVTDAPLLTHAQASADLFRAPFLAQQRFNPLPLGRAEPRAPTRSPAPRAGIFVRLFRSVASVVGGAVAPQLPADRTGRAPHLAGNLGLREAHTLQPCNAVSFLSGELVVFIHRCFLFLGGKWKLSVSQLARLFQGALHFVCESATHNKTPRPTINPLLYWRICTMLGIILFKH